MKSRLLKTGATILLATVAIPATASGFEGHAIPVTAEARAAEGKTVQNGTILSDAQIQSGREMPPLPNAGTLATLIAGFGMIGFATRRRSVAV
ncbi:hypothetical protein ACUJ46_05530 [Sandaracinobacteroides sp. A072]|uniref:hypothetical protein n=1 Tax=Sandaracinobacteroides sp. A072 TaxID=3461146 RepID=UPI00404141C9